MKPISCINPNGNKSYGGSQMWYEDNILVNSGCGIIAGLDSVLHQLGVDEIDRSEYNTMMKEAAGFIKPIMLPFKIKPIKVMGNEFLGSFGLTMPRLKRGVKKFSREKGIQVKTRSYRFDFVRKTREVLARGIPVILLVRAPLNNVTLISDTPGFKDEKIGQHFVTVTDYDEEKDLFIISSWGRRYKIDVQSLKKFSVGVSFCYLEPQTPNNA